MKTPAITTQPKLVSVPAIVDVDGLSVGEQVALAHIFDNPSCTNRGLSSLLGLTERGVEAMLARLRQAGHIRQVGYGRGRRHELTFAVESHNECGKTEIANTHTNCEPPASGVAKAQKQLPGEAPGTALAKREMTFDQFVDFHFDCFGICLKRGALDGALGHLKLLRERMEELEARLPKEMPRAEISRSLMLVTVEENRVKGYKWVALNSKSLSIEQAHLLMAKVKQADETQLVRLRQYIEANPVVGDAAAVLALLDAGR